MPDFLYPPINPSKEYTFPVTSKHTLYCAEYGNPGGIPVIYLHGGPGFGPGANTPRHYDPQKYRIIMLHQRGSGKSTPLGELADNHTQALIDDLEVARKKLNIDKWLVTGGSWGATLALAYTQQHPEQVLGLILRGVFLSRHQDTFAFLHDSSLGAQKYPEKWEKFKLDTYELIVKARLNISDYSDREYGFNYNACYAAFMKHPDVEIQKLAAKQYYNWEIGLSYVDPTPEKCADSVDGLNMGRLEPGYLAQKCFFRDNQMLEDIAKIKNIHNIPLYIAQGKHDMVCPPYQAEDLIRVWTAAGGKVDLQYTLLEAGHSMAEPEIQRYLVQAADHFAQQYRPASAVRQSGRSFVQAVNTSGGAVNHSGVKCKL
jgi:proline iminopeptidase